jgi:DNA polymerase III subunit epsilon
MKHLKLDRPLVCFDLETTGTDVVNDRIVQIALIRVDLDGSRQAFTSLVNPGRPIPPRATEVHGIRDEDVRDAPTLFDLRPQLAALLEGADLAGFNIVHFDLPLLQEELARNQGRLDLDGRRILDAMRIFHLKEPRNLGAAMRFYCGCELTDAHSAAADAEAALAVLDAQLDRYDDLPRDPQGLHTYCAGHDSCYLDRTRKLRWSDAGEAEIAFGKHQGRRLRDLASSPRDRGYLEWMLGGDFSQEVKAILREALAGNFPRRPGAEAPAGPLTLFPGDGRG